MLKDELKEKQIEFAEENIKITRFIEKIPDAQTRLIFRLRYIDNLSWRAVAFRLGGGNTEDNVRMKANNYIKRSRS